MNGNLDLTKDGSGTPAGILTEGIVYGGFWKRFVAYLIDFFLLYIVVLILSYLFGIKEALDTATANVITSLGSDVESLNLTETIQAIFSDPVFAKSLLMYSLLNILVWWLYFGFMVSSRYMGSIGYMALGLIVVDSYGRRISFARASARYFASIISALILYIGFIMIAFHPQKRGLHDLMTNVFVVERASLKQTEENLIA